MEATGKNKLAKPWRQKFKVLHAYANQRWKVNNISQIRDEGRGYESLKRRLGGLLPIIFKACSQPVEW
jgi:hypothetical protein